MYELSASEDGKTMELDGFTDRVGLKGSKCVGCVGVCMFFFLGGGVGVCVCVCTAILNSNFVTIKTRIVYNWSNEVI